MVERDNSRKSQRKTLKTVTSFCGGLAPSKPRLPTAINSGQSVQTRTNTAPRLMMCSRIHFCLESLLISASPSFSSFFMPSLCSCLCEYFSSEPLGTFWQGSFYIWTDSKRGKCKTLYPLLSSVTTWETSVSYLHLLPVSVPLVRGRTGRSGTLRLRPTAPSRP